jgi:hypothetical protein
MSIFNSGAFHNQQNERYDVFVGSGVFAKSKLSRGEFLTIYRGELIDRRLGEQRLTEVGGGYLFFIGRFWLVFLPYCHFVENCL